MDDDCIDTFETTRTRLGRVEHALAARLGIVGDVRRALIELDTAGRLVEDELVADWHDLLSSYIDWQCNLQYDRTRSPASPPPGRPSA